MNVNLNITGDYLKNGVPIGGGGSSNPSVIVADYNDGNVVTNTTANTISMTLVIPANTFTGNGMLEVLCRARRLAGATAGTNVYRIYRNTNNSLTGATLIAGITAGNTAFNQGIRTFRINSNVLTYLTTGASIPSDYVTNASAPSSTAFNTAIDQFIIFAIQPSTTTDSTYFDMARLVKYS
jgi:hypothetical protein